MKENDFKNKKYHNVTEDDDVNIFELSYYENSL